MKMKIFYLLKQPKFKILATPQSPIAPWYKGGTSYVVYLIEVSQTYGFSKPSIF